MKTKQERIDNSIQLLKELEKETIARYTEDIDFDQELSLYDVMLNHFVNGDFDDVLSLDITDGMNDDERNNLFQLVREFQGLCFYKGDIQYWLDSVEDFPVSDYPLVAYSILDNYIYLLELAKSGGRRVLEQLVSLRDNEELEDVALVDYLRTTFVDDRVLTAILLDMAEENSFYSMFTNEQKGTLLTYPEGTLYSYSDDVIKITSPLILGVQIYNSTSDDYIDTIDEANIQPLILDLSEFFRDENIDFYDEVLLLADKYRDYTRQKGIVLDNEFIDVVFDSDGDEIQDAWLAGDEILGSTYDTPYSGTSK